MSYDEPVHATIRTSGSIAGLAEALATAQKRFSTIAKKHTVRTQSYSYSYADLADIFDAIREPLAANGLSVIQPIVAHNGKTLLATRLMHSSGEWVESTYPLAEYNRPQDMGSAITYARRYSLGSLLGIVTEEDDDGASAQKASKPKASAKKEPAKPAPKPAAPAPAADELPPSERPASKVIKAKIKHAEGKREVEDAFRLFLLSAWEKDDIEALTQAEADAYFEFLLDDQRYGAKVVEYGSSAFQAKQEAIADETPPF